MKARLFSLILLSVAMALAVCGGSLAQSDCCLSVSSGIAQPPDHTWQFDPANPEQPNLMMHAKLCLQCLPGANMAVPITGVTLLANGTGNDLNDIAWIRVTADVNCNGIADPGEPSVTSPGGFPTDNGVLQICTTTFPPTQVVVDLNRCVCLLIEYNLKPNAPCNATYQFSLVSVLGPGCQPIPLCNPDVLLHSAVKTVICEQPCCLEATYGPAHPADHNFSCAPGVLPQPNFMMQARICNPCSTPVTIDGLSLTAYGSGIDPSGVQQVLVAVDRDCDGKDDGPRIPIGAYTSDNGTINFCADAAVGPITTLQPGQCVCLNFYYQMKCPTPAGIYCFTLDEIRANGCEPFCVNTLPLKSACKTVENCCLTVDKDAHNPANHVYTCVAGADNPPNFMQAIRVCNPCPTIQCINGIRLKAGGTGNDLTGISQIIVKLDLNCDGVPDTGTVLSGTYSADNGTVDLCTPAGGSGICLDPGQCICILVYYQMKCPAPAGTYYFDTLELLGGPNCQPLCANTLPIRSAVKIVQIPCCLEISKGPKHPADHSFTCTPNNPNNFMAQMRICNPCPTDQPIHGFKLQAFGSGNDLTGITSIIAQLDRNCDGVPDGTVNATGVYNADNGIATVCNTAQPIYVLKPGECICINFYYKMKCPNPPTGTYLFNVTDVLGPNCQPVCAQPLPFRSSVKTVSQCCLTAVKGSHSPSDHTFTCIPGVHTQPNFMLETRVCNPCTTDVCVYGLRLQAGGTGNDVTGIQKVLISLDYNCDGKPDKINVATGTYTADNGVLNLCSATAGMPLFCLAPGQCVCIRVEYLMTCPAVPGTYYFDLTALLGPGCQTSLCVETLPIRSAVKTIPDAPCCLRVFQTAVVPNHTFVCPPSGQAAPNLMQRLTICNPCETVMYINGLKLKAFGTGNDQTGISSVTIRIDANCDGIPDSGVVASGVYSADNGTVTLCAPTPLASLSPGKCICLLIYYNMKCPSPSPGTYQFQLTDLLGPNCAPICNTGLPGPSAIKTVSQPDCCLDIGIGPNNPPSHKWWPGLKSRNRMFQFQICNPCPYPVKLNCFTLQAFGTGNDKNDIAQIRIIRDLNCDGVGQIFEPVFGVGTYPADNGVAVICSGGGVILPPGGIPGQSCACFLVEYVMKSPGTINGTYSMILTQVSATNALTGQDVCKYGLPLTSNKKTRCLNIGQVKQLPVGVTVCLTKKAVTAVFPDRFYISELYRAADPNDPDADGKPQDRSAGIAVMGQVDAASTGGVEVDIEGVTDVVGCEVVVVPTNVAQNSCPDCPIIPLGVNNRNSGGGRTGNQSAVLDSFFDVFYSVETNNIGSLVRTWGKVTGSESGAGGDAVWIDDGSNLVDGTMGALGPHKGIRVDLSQTSIPGVQIPVGSFLHVTGIMQAIDNQGVCIRNLKPRTTGDVQFEAGPNPNP